MKRVLIILLAIAATAEAHHGWADFDSRNQVTFQGVVTAFHFTNPHCVVEFEAADEQGRVGKWDGEFASPRELVRKGWNALSLQPGDKLTIAGHPAKDGAPAIHVISIHLASGKVLELENGR